MRFLILSDMFSLESWLIENRAPEIMPAVYEFFEYLGTSDQHTFECFIFHKHIKKTITFDNGSVIQILPITLPFYYIRKFFSMFAMYGVAQKQIQKKSYDVIYGLGIYSTVASLIGQKYGILSVSRIFGSLVNDMLEKKQYIKLYSRYIFQYLEIKIPSDIIICTEDGTKFDSALQKINSGREVFMLLNGMQIELRNQLLQLPAIKKIEKNQLINIFSIGRLTYWKRHDLAIKTIYHLKEKFGLNIHLTILGRGEDKRTLLRLVKKLKLDENVTFRDPISHKEIPVFLKDQHIGLFLYDISNMGNAFWESGISGRMIVTRKNGKIDLLFKKNHPFIIDSNDPAIFAKVIFDHLDNDITEQTLIFRNMINDIIPNWKKRYEEEMYIIQSKLNRTS